MRQPKRHMLFRQGAFAAIPFSCAGRGDECVGIRFNIDTYTETIAGDDTARRMHDNAVANVPALGIKWFLYEQRAVVLPLRKHAAFIALLVAQR